MGEQHGAGTPPVDSNPGRWTNSADVRALGLVLLALAGAALLWLYAAHAATLFERVRPAWVAYQAALALSFLRDARVCEPALIMAVLVLAGVNTRRWIRWIGLEGRLTRSLAALTIGAAVLIVPFQVLAAISELFATPCLHPFNLLLVQLIVTLMPGMKARPVAPATPADPAGAIRDDAASRMTMLVGLIVTALVMLTTLALTQQRFRGYDALWYHLPTALQWRDLRTASIMATSPPFEYPQNGAVLAYYPLLGRLFFLNSAIQWGAALLTAWAIHWIAVRLNCPRSGAIVLACSYLSMPVVQSQGLFAGNDLVQALFLVLAAGFLVEAQVGAREATVRRLALGALAFGLAAGTKYHSLFFAPVYGAWAVWLLTARRGLFRRPAWGLALALCALGALVFLPAGYWYTRNLARHGAPFYPFGVRLAGLEGMTDGSTADPGVLKETEFVDRPADWWRYPFVERLKWADSWGAGMALAGYPLLLLPPLLAWRRRRRRPQWATAVAMLSAAAVMGWLGWALATWREPRYNLAVYAMMFASGGAILAISRPAARWISLTLLVAALAINAAFFAIRAIDKLSPLAPPEVPERADADLYRLLSDLPAGDFQAYAMGPQTLSLYGRDFKHRVFFSFGFDPEAIVGDNRRYVIYPVMHFLHGDPLADQHERFSLLFDRVVDRLRIKVFENRQWRDPRSSWARLGLPPAVEMEGPDGRDPTLAALFDGDDRTYWESKGIDRPRIEMRWADPLRVGWLDFHWGGLTCDKTNIDLRVGGRWERVKRIEAGDAGGMYVVRHTYVRLDGRPFDRLRVSGKREFGSTRFAGQATQLKLFDIRATAFMGWGECLQLAALVALTIALIARLVYPSTACNGPADLKERRP